MHNMRENARFFLLQGLYWAAYCVLFGYTVTIFGAYGYSARVCGIVTTLQYVVLLAVQPIYGYLMDNVVSPKWFFVALMSVGGLGAVGLPWAFTQPLPVIIAYFLFLSFFVFCGYAVADTWCIEVINRSSGMDYGLVRGGGSVLYAFAALAAGNLIIPLGVGILFIFHVTLSAAAVLLALSLPDPKKMAPVDLPAPELLCGPETSESGMAGGPGEGTENRIVPKRPSFGEALGLLLRNRAFVVYTLCMTCNYFASRATVVYMPIILAASGGNSGHYGVSMFMGSFGELFVMLFASRLLVRGFSMERMFGAATAVFITRFFLLYLFDNLWVILMGQLLMAVGFGLQVRVHAQYLSHITPDGYRATAILLCASIANGGGCILGNFIGGNLIDSWGIRPYVLLCAGVYALGFCIFLPTLLRQPRRAIDNEQ